MDNITMLMIIVAVVGIVQSLIFGLFAIMEYKQVKMIRSLLDHVAQPETIGNMFNSFLIELSKNEEAKKAFFELVSASAQIGFHQVRQMLVKPEVDGEETGFETSELTQELVGLFQRLPGVIGWATDAGKLAVTGAKKIFKSDKKEKKGGGDDGALAKSRA